MSTAEPPAVDTVLVAYKSDDVMERALTLAARLGGRSVVVDHGDGASVRIAARMGAVAIHDPANPGFGTGQNRGVSFTESEFVLLCNPDAQIVPEAVLRGVQVLRDRPDVAAVQGVIVNRVSGRPERSAGVEMGPVHLVGRAVGAKALLGVRAVAAVARRSSLLKDHADREPDRPVEVETLAATAVLVRRSAYDMVGGFDESYFLYGEDLDLCHRLRAAGWKLLTLPGVCATHTSGGSATSTWSREANWWAGTLQFGASRWSGPAWAAAVVAAGIQATRLTVRHPGRARHAWSAMVVTPLRRRAVGHRRPAVNPSLRHADIS